MEAVAAARRLAEEVLFPAAESIDAEPAVPRRYLDLLAGAGLYDLPPGGDAARVVEILGGASLVTAFVWLQHHHPVRAVAAAGGEVAAGLLDRMRAGDLRAGIAYAALRRPGPPAATAAPLPGGGFLLDGHAPWVTGWGLIDLVLAGARCGEDMVWLLLDAATAPGMEVTPLRLAALDASATVSVRWRSVPVPAERVLSVEPFAGWRRRDVLGLAGNGYLSIGVADRCARLLDSEELAGQVDAVRAGLDGSGPVHQARADASALAVRAAAAVVAAGGGRSMLAGSRAARLMREAMFLLVFGQTAEIRAAQLTSLSTMIGA